MEEKVRRVRSIFGVTTLLPFKMLSILQYLYSPVFEGPLLVRCSGHLGKLTTQSDADTPPS